MDTVFPALRVNGTSNAYAPQYGCGCPRCLAPSANTSVSLVAQRDDGALFHMLVDCGRGVATSLASDPLLRGRPLLDYIALTHWHGDHTADLPVVLPGLARTRTRHGDATRPKWWMRGETSAWVERDYPFLFGANFAERVVDPSHVAPGSLLAPLELDASGLHVQPFTVSHRSADFSCPAGGPASCCAGFIVHTVRGKTVLMWDIDDGNDWIVAPIDERERETVAALADADLLLIDCDSFAAGTPDRPATHASLQDVVRYATALRPKQTLLVHLSGHADAAGAGFGWTDEQWDDAAAKLWRQHRVPGGVRSARQGEWLPL